MSIRLITGDPSCVPATFTRFALPFRHSLQKTQQPKSGNVFRATAPADLAARRRYFTPETAGALFERANWYALDAPLELKLRIGDVAIDARLEATVVLFEADVAAHPVLHTGFLLLDLSFPQTQALFLDDLLLINEYFRYWRQPFDKHPDKPCRYSCDGRDRNTSYASFAATLPFANDRDLYTTRWTAFLSEVPVIKDDGAYRFVPRQSIDDGSKWIASGEGDGGWLASTDERAFVWTCALTKEGAGALSTTPAGHSGEWVCLLNVDRPAMGHATTYEMEWADARTYPRWAHCGTLYGFNEHSGAMLASDVNEPPLWRHFRGVYFDQVLLLLYVRTTTFRLSQALAKIHTGHQPLAESSKPFRKLRDSFARFANLYEYPLLSTQQQGLEMYVIARRALDIEPLLSDVRTQIETTHEHLELREQARSANGMTWLTLIATFAVLMTLLLTADSIKDPLLERLAFTHHPRLVLDLAAVLPFIALVAFWVASRFRQRRSIQP